MERYDIQVTLIEEIFRIDGKNHFNEELKDIIPEHQDLSQSFGEIPPFCCC